VYEAPELVDTTEAVATTPVAVVIVVAVKLVPDNTKLVESVTENIGHDLLSVALIPPKVTKPLDVDVIPDIPLTSFIVIEVDVTVAVALPVALADVVDNV
jgi:hypothetical protein